MSRLRVFVAIRSLCILYSWAATARRFKAVAVSRAEWGPYLFLSLQVKFRTTLVRASEHILEFAPAAPRTGRGLLWYRWAYGCVGRVQDPCVPFRNSRDDNAIFAVTQ